MDCAAASGALCCNDLLEVVAGTCSVEVAPLLSLCGVHRVRRAP